MKLPLQQKYPKFIYVHNKRYKIRFVKKFRYFGETDSVKQLIILKSGMSPRELFRTFIHEVLHAIEFEKKIQISHKAVYALEEGIYEVLFDNFI